MVVMDRDRYNGMYKKNLDNKNWYKLVSEDSFDAFQSKFTKHRLITQELSIKVPLS